MVAAMRIVAAGVLAIVGCSHAVVPDGSTVVPDGSTIYGRAFALASASKRDEALAMLETLPSCWTYPPVPHHFPNGVGDDPRFATIVAPIAKRQPIVHTATTAMTFHMPAMIPEGIAWDPDTKRLFVGSLYRREIVVVEPDGKARTFVGRDGGLDAVVGIRVDAERKLLWSTSDGTMSMADASPDTKGRSALASFDLATGAPRGRFELPKGSDGKDHFLNDLVVHHGDVYATDTNNGIVWKLAGGSFTQAATGFKDPNGITSDGTTIFVGDETDVSIIAGTTRVPLPHPPCTGTGGVDGLYYDHDALYAVQNGIGEPRVIRMQLDPAHRAITTIDTLETANPAFHIPTTGAIDAANHRLLVLADAWLGALDDEHHATPTHDDTTILAIPIP